LLLAFPTERCNLLTFVRTTKHQNKTTPHLFDQK
jgi:hypothetical protein